MVNGAQGVEVRIAVENTDNAMFGSMTGGTAPLRPSRPLPTVCSRHGDPEVERVRMIVSSQRSGEQDETGRVESAYSVRVAAVDWPVCGRCTSLRRRLQFVAAALCTLFAGVFLALVFSAMQGPTWGHGIALLAVFVALFVPLYVVLRLLEHRRGSVGVSLSEDGSEIVVAEAHPDFARAVDAERV